MAEKIDCGWLVGYDDKKFLPKTITSQILNSQGTYLFPNNGKDDNVGNSIRIMYIDHGVLTESTANIGSGSKDISGHTPVPVYLANGQITAMTITAGSAIKPIWLNAGTLTASDATVATDTKLMYLSNGELIASEATVGTNTKFVFLNGGTITESTANIGATNIPVYLNGGTITPLSDTIANDGKTLMYLNTGAFTVSTASVGSSSQPVYLSSGTLTAVPYTGIAYGGTGATTRVGAMSNLLYIGAPITTNDADTTTNWGQYGISVAYHSTTGQLLDQPSQYGLILTLNAGNSSNEVHQIWCSQPNGNLCHRGGNANDWSGTWKTILDSSNYSTHLDSRYVNVSGDTMTSTLTFQNTSLTKGTAPSSSDGMLIQWVDSLGTAKANRTGMLYNYVNTSNIAVSRLYAYAPISGDTETFAYISITCDAAGEKGLSSNATVGSFSSMDATFNTVKGAVWNDYAEYREVKEKLIPGKVVIETGLGDLVLATERLQPGANIISDTFGFSIGETEKSKTPIAVSGRALAYPYEDRNSYNPGDAVCTGPNGTISKMTREEIIQYPERIVGTVSEIPEYDTWGEDNILVNNRIWIKVK